MPSNNDLNHQHEAFTLLRLWLAISKVSCSERKGMLDAVATSGPGRQLGLQATVSKEMTDHRMEPMRGLGEERGSLAASVAAFGCRVMWPLNE